MSKEGRNATVAMNGSVKTHTTDFFTYSSSYEGRESDFHVVREPRMISTSPSIGEGYNLLQKLLIQLTLNDSPPANDTNNDFNEIEDATKEIRQAPSPTEHLPGTQFLSPQTLSLNNALNNEISLKQQGHISLGKLCMTALERLENRSNDSFQPDSSGLKLEKEQMRSQLHSVSNQKSQTLNWMKNKLKKNSFGEAGESREEASFTVDAREGRDASEVRRNGITKSERLQMFGSEYARFLSKTPLAPKDIPSQTSRRTFSRRTLKNEIQNIEEADTQVLTGPITDIIAIRGDEKPPKGYFRLSQTRSGQPFYLGDRKSALFLCVKKEKNWDRAAQRPCVTAVSIIFPDRKEFVPPGFNLVRYLKPDPSSSTQPPIDLNTGGSEAAYLCFRRSREGNPLTGIIPLLPSTRELIPDGYTVLERTPRNFVATFRASNGPIFLAYRQRLANLELLRPPPLVMSMLNGDSKVIRLESYYCTGGTVVKSKVGRFHIMDRSTHSLLSPSSINHRLSLIEISRKKTSHSIAEHSNVVGEKYSYSDASSVRSTNYNGIMSLTHEHSNECKTFESESINIADSDRQSSLGDFESFTSSLDFGRSFSSASQDSRSSFRRRVEPKSTNVDRCLEALSFIPSISPGYHEITSKDTAAFKDRVSILIPVLTSCYTRHGGSAFLSITGLTDLLRRDFYSTDMEMSRDPSSRTTLLDLSIQVVCDVATMGAQEAQLHACVEFVEEAVKFGCGYLSTRTVGYVLRFYLFAFHFGISSPSGNWGVVNASDQYLLEDIRFTTNKWALPGGAPQFAILSMKDLVVFMIARLGSQVHFDQTSHREDFTATTKDITCPHFSFIDKLVNKVVDDSVFRVGIANFTELAMHQILRSGGSELFWYEMIHLCGFGLFGNDTVLREETRHMYAVCFALLANCVKVAYPKIRKNEKSEGFPRDVANKLMSLEMLKFFLEKWERGLDSKDVPGSHSNVSFAFCIRRLVVPCLLANTSDALSDPRIFRRLIQVVGVLWCSPFYRKHMKLEVGILFDHFVLRLLKLDPQILFRSNDSNDTTYVFAQQLELMKEIKNWFLGDADRLLELHLNFDTDYGTDQIGRRAKALLPDLEWKISEHLCSLLCNISEECTEFLGDKIKDSHSSCTKNSTDEDGRNSDGYEGMSVVTLARESARRLRQGALDAVSQIVKALALSTAESIGEDFSTLTEAWYYGQKYNHNGKMSRNGDKNSRPNSAAVVGYWQNLGAANSTADELKAPNYDRTFGSRKVFPERRNIISVAISISNEKGLMKAIEYLIACDVLTASPREISSFLQVHCADFDPSALGKYLGECGSEHETDFWNQIRYNYIRATSFIGMTVDEGLRHLLTRGGFQLPGEAQQIDRLIATFARCYWEDNAGDRTCCPIGDEDTIFLVSFAIIMLNTDLHKSTHPSMKGKKRNRLGKMTKDEFISNLIGANKGDAMAKEYLSKIYDDIEKNPIALHTQIVSENGSASRNLKKCVAQMRENVKNMDALLRGLAIHEYQYFPLQDYSGEVGGTTEAAKLNLARALMAKSWHPLHGLINSVLKIAHLDPKALDSCIDLLKFTLCLTICLDMPTQQTAFLDQLGRFRLFNTWRKGATAGCNVAPSFNDRESYKKEKWYIKMKEHIHLNKKESLETEPYSISTKSYICKFESLLILNRVVDEMGVNVRSPDSDAAGRKILRDVARRIENSEFLLNDPTRIFLREGNVVKRANRSGKHVEYRFFLFSDILIYGKKIKHLPSRSPSTDMVKYRIHEELPLIMMKVVDWFPPDMKKQESKRAIQFYHPRKKFLVFCNSNNERNSWVNDIRQAIQKELKRKMAIESARKAAANVPPGNPVIRTMPSTSHQSTKSCMKSFL